MPKRSLPIMFTGLAVLAVLAASAGTLPQFAGKVEMPALALAGTKPTIPLAPVSSWGGFTTVATEVPLPKNQAKRGDAFVITPPSDVDYKLIIVTPPARVDYNLIVKP